VDKRPFTSGSNTSIYYLNTIFLD